jgi:hypothetical protein
MGRNAFKILWLLEHFSSKHKKGAAFAKSGGAKGLAQLYATK